MNKTTFTAAWLLLASSFPLLAHEKLTQAIGVLLCYACTDNCMAIIKENVAAQ